MRSITDRCSLALVAAAVVATACGCGATSPSARSTPPPPTVAPSEGPSVSGSPSTVPSTSANVVEAVSATAGYDADLGGEFQAVGVRVTVRQEPGSGSVAIDWVPRVQGSPAPMPRLHTRPGVIDVYLRDMRPHTDIVRALASPSGPVARAQFVFPPDDALVILRLTLRDETAAPRATVLRSTTAGAQLFRVDIGP